ncbi:hypothetical protein SAMCCGM7_pB0099 (plasmid) [Sinorhizobium americanum CCGM7]|nr:hypothetical protein SAMCCGM7_pB0099 [Sinorhizobium americanum CCGM7]
MFLNVSDRHTKRAVIEFHMLQIVDHSALRLQTDTWRKW